MTSNYWSRRIRRRGFLAGAGTAGLGAAAMLAAGCGDDDDAPQTAAPATGGTTAATTAATTAGGAATATQPAAAAIKLGGTYQINAREDLIRDHLTQFSGPAVSLNTRMYGGLMGHKSAAKWQDAYAYETYMDIASSVEQPDKTTYTFKLNPEAKFQGIAPVNGRRVTADDVVKTYERFITEPKNASKADYTNIIESMKATDASTVVLKSKKPYSALLTHLIAFRQFYVYPVELLSDDALRSKQPIGSGPFQLGKVQEGTFWEFTRNPTYHRKDDKGGRLPRFDTVRINVIPDDAQIVAQFAGGNLDKAGAAAPISYDNKQTIAGRVKDAQFLDTYSTTWNQVSPQQRRGPFQDPRNRQAVSLAIDRDALLAIEGGPGSWCNFIGPNMGKWMLDPKGADAGPGAANFKKNPGEARKLLEASGLINQTVDFNYTNGYGDGHVRHATVVIDQLKQAGFKLNPKLTDYRTEYLAPGGKGVFFGEYEGLMFGLRAGYPHPSQSFNVQVYSKGIHNNGGWNDAELDKAIDDLGQDFDAASQLKRVHDLQRLLANKLIWTPTVLNQGFLIYQSWIKDARIDPLYEADSDEWLWSSKA